MLFLLISLEAAKITNNVSMNEVANTSLQDSCRDRAFCFFKDSALCLQKISSSNRWQALLRNEYSRASFSPLVLEKSKSTWPGDSMRNKASEKEMIRSIKLPRVKFFLIVISNGERLINPKNCIVSQWVPQAEDSLWHSIQFFQVRRLADLVSEDQSLWSLKTTSERES